MDSARWQRIQTIFHDAADLSPSERAAFVRMHCDGDDALAAEILGMLRHDAADGSVLDQNVAMAANGVLAGSDAVASQFGPYRIVRVLGEGGMGIVYLAERTDLHTRVAIKVLRDAWLSPARRERFAAEQRTLAQLNHPWIARFYDASVLPDGTPYFVMEYIEGIPLTEYCADKKCTIEQRLQLFRQICEAVQHAHSHAVIHRDLKPSNILVKEDGSVRLLDFGIARQIESLGVEVDQTITGLRLMTPAYASPEQVRGDRIGISTDVYSLGVILYELLAGAHPFDLSNLTPAEAASIIATHDPGKPSAAVRRSAAPHSGAAALSRSAWADLDVLCVTAMHKDPQRRYRSVEALIRDVDHYLRAEPLEARPESRRYRAGKFVQRHRRAAAGIAAAVVLMIAMATFFMLRLARARDAAIAQAARVQRIQGFMTSLFQGGDPSAGPDNNLRVVTMVDRGLQQAQSLNADPEVQAELYETLGGLYEKLGKLDEANLLLNKALDLHRSLYGADSTQAGETLVALGALRDDQAQLPEAERLVREGLAIEERHLPSGHPTVVKATTALGKVLEDRGSYAAAIATLNDAVKTQPRDAPPTPEFAAALYELANCQFYAGHYDTAEALNQRLLPIDRQLYGDRHPRVADVLVNLGAIRHDLGHYPEAEPFERQALEIVQRWYGNDHPETASDLTMLARTLVFEGRYDEATALLQQSLVIKERVYGPVHPAVASSLNELGNTAMRQGKYDLAAKYFTRMADIYHAIYGEQHYLLGIALSNLAGAYAGKQDWPRAEALFRQAVQIFTKTQSADHINTGIARIKLGRTLLRERRYAEAQAESLAGYEILSKQLAPGASWLVNARRDLVEEYTVLQRPEDAQRFRAELAAASLSSAVQSSGK